MNTEHPLKNKIMAAIKDGSVHMRPRWHFILFSSFALVGVAIVVLGLVYIASLLVFFMRDSGMWFIPSFGSRGWWEFFHALPWMLVLLIGVFVVLLQVLVRRYSFIYKKPLITSLCGIMVLVLAGGYFVGMTRFHHHMDFFVEHEFLPPPLNGPMHMLYRGPLRMERPHDVYRGYIVSTSSGGFIVRDSEADATSSVVITRHTRLPYGEDFEPGMMIIVVGDDMDDGSIKAFGIRTLDDE